MAKRSHSELAKVISKRADQKFYIIAVDHLHDMVTRAIGSGTMSSPGASSSFRWLGWELMAFFPGAGGYTSTVLETWNKVRLSLSSPPRTSLTRFAVGREPAMDHHPGLNPPFSRRPIHPSPSLQPFSFGSPPPP